jgi:dipeptidyl aminopeptidase/acylaminoacyl peptidase
MNRIKKSLLAAACVLPALGMVAGVAHAQATQQVKTVEVTVPYLQAGKISVETFVRRAEFSSMVMSPDGNKLAALAPLKGRNNLVVIDLVKRTRNVITSFETLDVAVISWVNNDRIFFRAADGQDVTGRFTFRGQYAVNADGTELRDLTRIGESVSSIRGEGKTVLFDIRSRVPQSNDIIISASMRTRDSDDLYQLDTKTGKLKLLTFDSPGRVSKWVMDRNRVPRIAVRSEKRESPGKPTKSTLWHRTAEGAKWEQFFEHDNDSAAEQIDPLNFDFDNSTLYVASNVGRDKSAIYKFDLAAKKLGELVFEDALIDIEGGLIFSDTKKKLVGIRYSPDVPRVKWFDEESDKLQRQIDATFPKTFNDITGSDAKDGLRLIFARSDVDPGEYHLYDDGKKSLESLVRTREWISPEIMSPRKFIQYKARDGRMIPAWLTIPKGSAGTALPLIVHIHGGPRARSYFGTAWGRTPYAQFFASRGYAVLEPEPRGSTGFGRSHDVSGYKKWGDTMQDDLTDGALHLVKEGIVDKSRMGLFGGSYGGYATLQGMVKEPDLFKAGFAVVAVSDLFVLQNVTYSDTAQLSDYLDTDFKRWVGDPVADRAQMTLTSPALNADKVKGKVAIVMGSDDVRVPLIHGERMRDALDKAGNPAEWRVYTGEGHGFNKDANVIDHAKHFEAFFAKHLK